MASVSSRVVNTRAQEQIPTRSPVYTLPEEDEDDDDDDDDENPRHDHGNTSHQDVSRSSDVLPRTTTSANVAGSEHGSTGDLRRSGSRHSSGSHAGGSNQRTRTSTGQNGQATGHVRSGTGSQYGKTTTEAPEKVRQDDEESVFVPGGFAHRGGDKMRLEGRSLMIFAPDNPIRLWLASILMSKFTDPFILVVILAQWVFFVITPTTKAAKNDFGAYWTHYGLLAVNIICSLEIMAKVIVYGLFFDRNGFQWKKWLPKGIFKLIKAIFPSQKTSSLKPTISLTRINSANSRASATEKARTQSQPLTPNKAPETHNPEIATPPAHAPFFSSYYNRLDAIAAVSYWIDLAFMWIGIREVYIFKAISALRPLRLLSLTEGTSTIIDSLSSSAPLLLNILIFIFFFFLILSLIGLLVFQGALARRCSIQDDGSGDWTPVSPEVICGGYYSNGTIMGIFNYVGQGDGDDSSPRRQGKICPEGQICVQYPDYNPSYGLVSFDNIFYSLLTVFTISSMEGWTDVEYWVMNGDSRWAAIFFCVAIFIMSFLMIPLFIAGITYAFGAVRAEKKHSAFSSKTRNTRTLLETDEGWLFDDQIGQAPSSFRQWVIRLVNHPWFPTFGAFLVFLNLIAMCFRRYDNMPEEVERLDTIEMVFTLIFLVEICLRLAGPSTWSQFWVRKSNKADLFLAIATTILLVPAIQQWEWFRYLTAFQVMRAYRLIPAIPGVRDLMLSVMGSASGMLNLLLITFMFLLVCSPVPMILFGGDMRPDDPQPLNFDDLGQSFISLFIILTGENWVNIMYQGVDSQPEKYKQAYGAIFFVIYYCASHYVLLNLFIAIILEQFEMDEDEKYKKQLEIYFQTHQRSKIDGDKHTIQYLNPYAYLPARPQTLSVYGLPVDQTVSIRKNVFRQFLEGDAVPTTNEIVEYKTPMIVWLERMRDYWFPTQAQLEAIENDKVHAKAEKQDLNRLNGGVSGFGKTQDEIDASLERLDAGLEKITWDLNKSSDDPQAATGSTEGYRRGKAEGKSISDHAEMREFLEAHPMYDRSLFVFSSNNRFRQWCRRLVGPRTGRRLATMNRFNWFIFACIVLSIAVVIADDPVDRQHALKTGNTVRQDVLENIDDIITVVFVWEQFLRVLADGFIFTPTAYLRDPWNFMDFFVVIMSCVLTFAQIDHLYSVSRAVRALSCLRVLRIIRYFQGVSAMFKAIAKALPRMVVAFVLTVLLFWPFAIYGLNIYSGYFYLCNDHGIFTKSQCVGEFMGEVDGDAYGDLWVPRVWSNPYDYSFDTIQTAVLTLFEMASQEGWVVVMQSGRATPFRLGEQPYVQPDEPNRFNSFYFLAFMLVGSIVFVQIFIGVILETFKTWNGISLMTLEQRRWIDLRRQIRLIRPTATPERPQNSFRAFCYDLIQKRGILWHMMTMVLVLNVCLIASQHYGQPEVLTDIQDVFYFIFLGLYSIEITVKITGYGFHKWRLSRWNLYDLVITALALITLIPRFVGHQLWTLRLEKFLLITISFRLAQRLNSLQVLFQGLAIAFGSILNITAVFMVVLTVYAVMFRELFGMTRLGPSTSGLANFETFGNTMLMLIRMTTGENWDFVMHDMMIEPPNCTPSRTSYLDGDCGSRPWAYFVFLSFYIICTYIVLNMFIAVIISNFSFAYQQDSLTTLITREDLRNYKITWAKFDPRGTGYISPKDLSKFLGALEGRLSTKIYHNQEYSIPCLVKTYSLNTGSSTHLPSPVPERISHPSSSPSPSVHNSGSHRSVLGLGSSRRLNRRSVNRGLSSLTSRQGTESPKSVPIAVSGSEHSTTEEKRSNLDHGLDLQGLYQALSKIDTEDVSHRRRIYNLVYKEALATCTPRGISFYRILDILSYTLVDTKNALGMDEFLQRNERVKEIKAAVARETIHNLLLTIIARRNFLKQRRGKMNSRLRPEVPRIVIDTSVGNERGYRPDTSPMLTSSPSGRSSLSPSPVLDFFKGHHSDDDIPPIGGFSGNTVRSSGSNDSQGWDIEKDSLHRTSGQSDSSDYIPDPRIGSSISGYTVEGSTWFNMLQDQINEQDGQHQEP